MTVGHWFDVYVTFVSNELLTEITVLSKLSEESIDRQVLCFSVDLLSYTQHLNLQNLNLATSIN